jgi:hypothetical protein
MPPLSEGLLRAPSAYRLDHGRRIVVESTPIRAYAEEQQRLYNQVLEALDNEYRERKTGSWFLRNKPVRMIVHLGSIELWAYVDSAKTDSFVMWSTNRNIIARAQRALTRIIAAVYFSSTPKPNEAGRR